MTRVFIVGCPRSGSTWVSFLLTQHPRIATYQHARLFDYLVHLERWYGNKKFSMIDRPPSPEASDAAGQPPDAKADNRVRLWRIFPEEDLYRLLGEFASGVVDRVASVSPEISLVVDKTPENAMLAEFIHKVYPEAYFLHVVRDPRSAFCSHRSASASWARWEFPTQPIDGATYWRTFVEAACAIERITDRYLLVRYEDLERDGPGELARIFSWLGIEAGAEFCARAVAACTKEKMQSVRYLPSGFVRSTPANGWREELTTGDARIIEHLAGGWMAKLGYQRSQPPFRYTPLRVRFQEIPQSMLAFLDRKLHRLTQLAHWGWTGRKLEWPEP